MPNMRLLAFCCWLWLCLATQAVFGQTRTYTVQVLGSEVGELSVTREVSGRVVKYTMTSDAEVDYWVGSTVAQYRSTVLVVDGKVTSVSARTVRDGETERFTRLHEEQGRCVSETKKGKTVLSECPSYCVAMMFFAPPKGLKTIFSEDFGAMVQVGPDANQVYVVSLPDGKRNRYRYNEGGMVELISGSALGKAVLTLKEP